MKIEELKKEIDSLKFEDLCTIQSYINYVYTLSREELKALKEEEKEETLKMVNKLIETNQLTIDSVIKVYYKDKVVEAKVANLPSCNSENISLKSPEFAGNGGKKYIAKSKFHSLVQT
jgi:ABC-type phosphate transport system auxiliary subunit